MIQFIARLEIAKSKGESKYKELITEFNKTNSQGYTINDRDSGSMQLLDKKGGDVTPPQIMKVITEIHKPQD